MNGDYLSDSIVGDTFFFNGGNSARTFIGRTTANQPVVAVHNATGNTAIGLGATNPPGRFAAAVPLGTDAAVVQFLGPTAGANLHTLALGYGNVYNSYNLNESAYVQVEWQGHGYYPLRLQPLGGVLYIGKLEGVEPVDFPPPDRNSDNNESKFRLNMVQQVNNVANTGTPVPNKFQIMASFEMETTIPAGPGNDVGCGRFTIKQKGRTEANGGGAWVRALEAQAARLSTAANNRTWGLEVGCHNVHSGGLPHTSVGIYVSTGNQGFLDGPPKRCNTAILIDGKTTSPQEDGWDRFILCRKGDLNAAEDKFEVDRSGSITAQGTLNNTLDILGHANIYAFNNMEAGGTVTATQFITYSSELFKENIVPLQDAEATSLLAQLTPVTYDLTTRPGRRLMGFVAENVPASFVVETEGLTKGKGVDTMSIIATLAGVVRAHQAALSQLQVRVNQLESRGTTP